eukprot:Clim_evm15s252 gene=Clim_evmTU15s252
MGSFASKIGEVPNKMAERQKAVQLQVREVQMAVGVAQARDLLNWVGAFTGTVGVLGMSAAMKTRSPAGLIPLLPLSFMCAYQYDFAYGEKLRRVRDEAGRILEDERKAASPDDMRFAMPVNNKLIEVAAYHALFGKDDSRSDEQ